MLTEKTKIPEHFKIDAKNRSELITKIKELYNYEMNEIIDKIILKHEGEFMRTLSNRVQALLAQEYSEDIYEDYTLTSLLRTIEKEMYLSLYKKVKMALNNLFEGKNLIDPTYFSFRKHCNYQGNSMVHQCLDGKITSSFLCNKEYLACKRCFQVYRLSCVKLYCNFCSIEYYTIFTKNSGEMTPSNIQPATWDKYHCNTIFNDQMNCIQCKDKLYLNISENKLVCLQCGFQSKPQSILWRCLICSGEFRSGAKIYNPLEYKMFKNSIKEAKVIKDYAKPDRFPCNHDNLVESMIHKSDCDGKMLIGSYHDSKIVVCDKCNVVTLYDKFIWTCSICSKRFRESTSEKYLLNSFNDDESLSYNYSTNDSGATLEKSNSLYFKSPTKDDQYSQNKKEDSFKLTFKVDLDQIESLPPMNSSNKTPEIDLDDYTIISEIAEGGSSKVYAALDSNNGFHALKRHTYTRNLVSRYELQYSIQCNEIVQLEGISIDHSQKELNVLEELGICDLEKEIVSRKRIKKYYSEGELVNLLLQISSGLYYLQINGYVHWNICPCNIIVFKDDQYKICDFSSLRKISDNVWGREENDFTPPKSQISNMIKADTYCLGLTMVYISTLMYQCVEDIISIDYNNKNYNDVNDNITKVIQENFPKERFSDQYVDLILNMLNPNVNKRYDFKSVINFINKNYNSSSRNDYS